MWRSVEHLFVVVCIASCITPACNPPAAAAQRDEAELAELVRRGLDNIEDAATTAAWIKLAEWTKDAILTELGDAACEPLLSQIDRQIARSVLQVASFRVDLEDKLPQDIEAQLELFLDSHRSNLSRLSVEDFRTDYTQLRAEYLSRTEALRDYILNLVESRKVILLDRRLNVAAGSLLDSFEILAPRSSPLSGRTCRTAFASELAQTVLRGLFTTAFDAQMADDTAELDSVYVLPVKRYSKYDLDELKHKIAEYLEQFSAEDDSLIIASRADIKNIVSYSVGLQFAGGVSGDMLKSTHMQYHRQQVKNYNRSSALWLPKHSELPLCTREAASVLMRPVETQGFRPDELASWFGFWLAVLRPGLDDKCELASSVYSHFQHACMDKASTTMPFGGKKDFSEAGFTGYEKEAYELFLSSLSLPVVRTRSRTSRPQDVVAAYSDFRGENPTHPYIAKVETFRKRLSLYLKERNAAFAKEPAGREERLYIRSKIVINLCGRELYERQGLTEDQGVALASSYYDALARLKDAGFFHTFEVKGDMRPLDIAIGEYLRTARNKAPSLLQIDVDMKGYQVERLHREYCEARISDDEERTRNLLVDCLERSIPAARNGKGESSHEPLGNKAPEGAVKHTVNVREQTEKDAQAPVAGESSQKTQGIARTGISMLAAVLALLFLVLGVLRLKKAKAQS